MGVRLCSCRVTACVWPAGTCARAYDANRKAAVEGLIERDTVAVCIRRLMAERGSWAGTASDLLRAAAYLAGDDISKKGADWPRHPGALAGRLRRVHTSLRMLGIDISFSREGRAGTPRASAPSAASAAFAMTSRRVVNNSHKDWGIRHEPERC